MALTSTIVRVQYNGNGITTAFPTTFYFLANSHVLVYLTIGLTDTLQTETTHYTLTGAGNPMGGTVTFLTPPPTGSIVTIARQVPITQETDYVEGDPFPADSHERALDKLTMICQQLFAGGGMAERSIRYPITEPTPYTTELPPKATRAGKTLAFDSAGNLILGPPLIGTGDVTGPNASVDNRIVLFDGTTGKLIKQAALTIADVLNRANHTGTQPASTITGLHPVATSGSYSALSGIPTSFPPSAHTHPLSDLTASGATLGQVPRWNGSAWAPATPNPVSVALLQDVKPTNTPGGTNTPVATWNTRTLNTIAFDPDSIVLSLTTNQFTLGPGSYLITAIVPNGTIVNPTRARLYNVTAATVTAYGESAIHSSAQSISRPLIAHITLAANTAFRIEHRGQNSAGTQDLGRPSNIPGVPEIYTQVLIQKLN